MLYKNGMFSFNLHIGSFIEYIQSMMSIYINCDSTVGTLKAMFLTVTKDDMVLYKHGIYFSNEVLFYK